MWRNGPEKSVFAREDAQETEGRQPATTTITAITAITQLTSSEDMTRTERELDDESGEIMDDSF